MKDYVIYKIVCKDLNVKEIYLGMTINFNVIRNTYKYIYNNRLRLKPNMNLFNYIFLHGGFDNFLIEIIKIYNCENVKEANIFKRQHYNELQPTLNKNRPSISREEIFIYQRDYHTENKIELKNKLANKRQNMCRNVCYCGKSYTQNNFTNHCKTEFHLSHININ